MYKILAAACFVMLVGGISAVMFAGTDPVQAQGVASGKGDRLDIKPTLGSACSQTSWPYYETSCLRGTVSATRDVRPVRIVSTDRLPR